VHIHKLSGRGAEGIRFEKETVEQSMSKKLKVGIVGAAARGGCFVSAFQKNPDSEVTAYCDLNEEGMKKAAQKDGVEHTFTDYAGMLDSGLVDTVIVGTPMPLHVPQSIAALQRDIHVMSEVPAGVSLQECKELVLAARESRGVYMMSENYCYIRSNVLVREIVRRGLFGDIYFGEGEYVHELKGLNEVTRWRRKWQTGTNGNSYITHSLGPLLQWFEGQRVVSVSCVGSGHHYRDAAGAPYEQEDCIITLCRLSGGGLLEIRLDMLSERPHRMDYYSLQGTTGVYEAACAPGSQPRIWTSRFSPDKVAWRPLEEYAEEFLPEVWLNPPPEAEGSGHWGGDYMIALDFINAALGEKAPPIGINEAMDMTLPGLVSQESIRRGSSWLLVPDSRDW